MNLDETNIDSDSPPAEPSPKKIPAWARAPIFMYLTLVAAFAIAGIFVVYYVLKITSQVK